VQLLARREHSALELRRKLEARGIERDAAVAAVQELAAAGWQSDARYVDSLVRTRIGQGYGPLRIESELEAAGVASALIRETLVAVEVDWSELAAQAQERHFGAVPVKATDWQKQFRYLQSRGFESSQIYKALKRSEP
jgi:regulatory protein